MDKHQEPEQSEVQKTSSESEPTGDTQSRLLEEFLQCKQGQGYGYKPQRGDDLKFNETGGQTIEHRGQKPEDNYKETQWPNGVRKVEYQDGRGFVCRPSKDGSWTIDSWGPKANDNYALTRWPDETWRIEYKDGRGRALERFDRDKHETPTTILNPDFERQWQWHVQSWGPHPWHNYTEDSTNDRRYKVTKYSDGYTAFSEVDKDGTLTIHDQAPTLGSSKITLWADGRMRLEDSDNRGSAFKPDGKGGCIEHHWGPRPEDNYDRYVGLGRK